MKKKLKRLLTYSVYRKAMLLYAISIVLVTALILMSLFGAVAYYVKNNATENSEILLNQLVSTSDYIKTDVDTLLSVVANNSSTLNFVRSKQENKIVNYYLYQDLNALKSSYSYVVDLSVVNLERQVSVQTTGTNVNHNVNYGFVMEAIEAGRTKAPRRIVFNDPLREYDVVSFLYYLPYSQSAVVADVNVERFKLDISENDEISREVLVIDEDGNQIIAPEKSPVSQEGAEYLNEIIAQNGKEKDRFMFDDAERKLILFFCRSETMGWWFVDAQSYSRFFSTYQTIAFIFFGVALAFLALCLLLSMAFGQRMRKPLVQLVEKCRADFETNIEFEDEIKYLDQAIAKAEHERFLNDNYVRSLYLQRVLLGRDMPFFVSREKQEQMKARYEAAHYCVILLQIQPLYEVEADRLRREMSLLRYTVCNLADDLFGIEYRCEAVDVGEDLAAVMILLEGEELGEDYLFCFRNLKEFAAEQIRIQVSGSVGSLVDSFDELRFSYAKAKQYLGMNGIMGKGEIIDSNSAANAGYQEKNERLVDSLLEYTKENYSNPDLSLKSVSQKFGLSTTYLGKIFKSVKGESYSAFVTGYRLEQSKLALLETSKTVNEISAEVGFANSTYFATVFKNTYGMTPTAFRNGVK